MAQQFTQGRIGHLAFGTPDTDILLTAQRAISEFAAKHPGTKPSMMIVHEQHQEHHEALAGLGIGHIIFGGTLPHHCWIGAEKQKTGSRSSVRVVESSRERVAVMAAADALTVTEKRIAIPVIDDTEIIRTFIALSAPALDAPKIAGLLCAVNPRGPEEGAQDGEGESAAETFAAMVLDLSMSRVINPEYIYAWKVAHSSSDASKPALLALVKDGSPQQWIEREVSEAERPWRDLLEHRMKQGPRARRISRMYGRQIEDALPAYDEAICLSAPHVVLPQEVTMHPRDVMRELASQKREASALRIASNTVHPLSFEAARERRQQQAALIDETPVTKPTEQATQGERGSEDLLEEAAMARLVVTPQALDLFIEELSFIVANLDNADARLMVNGHRVQVLDQKHVINVFHPKLSKLKGTYLRIAIRTDEFTEWEYNATRHAVRIYLETCAKGFEKLKVTPISAGEFYDFEMKAQRGKKIA